jgi:cytochrome P450
MDTGEPGEGAPLVAIQQFLDYSDPQPAYRALLESGDVAQLAPGLAMAVSRDAVNEAAKHPDVFSSGGIYNLGNVRPLIPLAVDPPDHAKYRKILDPLFAPKRMDALEDAIAARANHFIDEFVDRGGCEYHDEFAVPFPSAIFLELMGLPWEELDTFLRLKDGILRPGDGEADIEAMTLTQAETGREIYRYFDAVLDERAQHPRDDILSHFLAAEVDGERLTREEILDICFLFLIAGLDTVTDSLSCFYAFLAQHPTHRRLLAGDPAMIPGAVEELLRWESPVPNPPRLVTTDSQLLGERIPAGCVLQLGLGPANVDPDVIDDPFDVRFDREANPHVAFGVGVHRCLGSHLARRELRVALREWHRRIPEYELVAGTELQYPPGLRSVQNLQLHWPGAGA